MATERIVNTDYKNLGVSCNAWHTVMTNEYIEDAMMKQDQTGKYQVAFSLTSEGTDVFAKHTSENIGTYLCIVLDKEVISCPRIQSAITGEEGVVSGKFTYESAETLTVVQNTAALPFPVEYISDVDAVE